MSRRSPSADGRRRKRFGEGGRSLGPALRSPEPGEEAKQGLWPALRSPEPGEEAKQGLMSMVSFFVRRLPFVAQAQRRA